MSIPWPGISHHHVAAVVKVLALFVSPLAFVAVSKNLALLARLVAVKPKPVSRARFWEINDDSDTDEGVLKTEHGLDENPIDHEVLHDSLCDLSSHPTVVKDFEASQGELGANQVYCMCGASTDALDWISPTIQDGIAGEYTPFSIKEHRSRSAGGNTRFTKERKKPFRDHSRNPEPDSNKNSSGHAIHSDEKSFSPVSEILLPAANGADQGSQNTLKNMSLAKVQNTIEEGLSDKSVVNNGFCRSKSNQSMQAVGRENEARQSSKDGGTNPGLMETERCASSDYFNHLVAATRKLSESNNTIAKENYGCQEFLPNSPCLLASNSDSQTPCKTTLKESELKFLKNQQEEPELEGRVREKLQWREPSRRAKLAKKTEVCSQGLWEDKGLSDVKDREDATGPVPHPRRRRRCRSAEDHDSTQPAVSTVGHESCAEPHQVPSNSSSCDSYSTAPCSSVVSSESGLGQSCHQRSAPTQRDFLEDSASESRANMKDAVEERTSSPQIFKLATPPRFLPQTWCNQFDCQRKLQHNEQEDSRRPRREESGTVPLFELMASAMRTWFPSLYKGHQANREQTAAEKSSQPNEENDHFQDYDIRNVFGPQKHWSCSLEGYMMGRAKACPHSCVSSLCNFRGTVQRWKKELLLTQCALGAPSDAKASLPCSFCHEDYQCQSPLNCYLQHVVQELWSAVFEFKRSCLESVECPYVRQHSSEQLPESAGPARSECSLGHRHSCNRDYSGCSQLSIDTVSEESPETPCAHVLMHEIDSLLHRLKRLKQATKHERVRVSRSDGVQPKNWHQGENRQRETDRHAALPNNHNKTTNFADQPLLGGMNGSKQDNSMPKVNREEEIQWRREEHDDSQSNHDGTSQLSDGSSTSSEDADSDTKYREGTAREESEGLADENYDKHEPGHPRPPSVLVSASLTGQLAELEAVTEILLGKIQNDDAGHEVQGDDSLLTSFLSSVNEMIPRESTEYGRMEAWDSPVVGHHEASTLRRQLSELSRGCRPSSSSERHAPVSEERPELLEGKTRVLGKLAQCFLEHIEHSLGNTSDSVHDSTRGSLEPTCEGDSPRSGLPTRIADDSFSSYSQSEKDPQKPQERNSTGLAYSPAIPSSSQTLHTEREQKPNQVAVVTDSSSPGASLVSAFQKILGELDGLQNYKGKNACDGQTHNSISLDQFQLHQLSANGNIGEGLENHHFGQNIVDETIRTDKSIIEDGYNVVERIVGKKIRRDPPKASGSDKKATAERKGANVEDSEVQQTDPTVISAFNELITDLTQFQLQKTIAKSGTGNHTKRKNIKNVKFDPAIVQSTNPSAETTMPLANSLSGSADGLKAPSYSFPNAGIADCADDLCVKDLSVAEAFDQLDKIVDDLLQFMDVHETVK